MNLVERYNSIKLRALKVRSRKETLEITILNNKSSLQAVEETLVSLNKQKSNLLSSIDLMKQLIDILSREQINQLRDLISYGLATIFHDRSYSIDIQVSESRSVKQATFFLVETLSDGTVIRSDFRDSIGGGILSVVGLIIQVYYILYYNQYPILFMDEALSQISTTYLPSVLEFIDQLSVKKNFKFVLITHDTRLIEYGKRVYSVTAGNVQLLKS